MCDLFLLKCNISNRSNYKLDESKYYVQFALFWKIKMG